MFRASLNCLFVFSARRKVETFLKAAVPDKAFSQTVFFNISSKPVRDSGKMYGTKSKLEICLLNSFIVGHVLITL